MGAAGILTGNCFLQPELWSPFKINIPWLTMFNRGENIYLNFFLFFKGVGSTQVQSENSASG